MLKPDDERAIQDYLDNRLAPDRRAAFERRLAVEPELARRIADDRALAQALRDEPPALSPGFYTRARARFEQRRAPRRWPRLLSWEAAGLAATVVLALAIFLPPVLQREESGSFLPVPAPVRERENEPARTSPAVEAQTRELAAEVPAEIERSVKDDAKGAVSGEEGLPVAQEPSPRLAQEPTEPSKKQEAAEKQQEPLRKRSEPEGLYSPAPPVPLAEADAKLDRLDADEPRLSAMGANQAPGDDEEKSASLPAPYSRAMESFAATPPLQVVALPAGVADPQVLRSIIERGEWETLERGPGGAASRRLGGWRAGTRLVLVGARPEGLDCATVEVRVDPGVPRFVLTFSRSPVASPGGCALALADNGFPLVLEERTR